MYSHLTLVVKRRYTRYVSFLLPSFCFFSSWFSFLHFFLYLLFFFYLWLVSPQYCIVVKFANEMTRTLCLHSPINGERSSFEKCRRSTKKKKLEEYRRKKKQTCTKKYIYKEAKPKNQQIGHRTATARYLIEYSAIAILWLDGRRGGGSIVSLGLLARVGFFFCFFSHRR